MFSPALDSLLRQAEQTQRIVWGALVASILLYVGIAIAQAPEPGGQPAPLTLPLVGVAIVLASVSIGLRGYAQSEASLRRRLRFPHAPFQTNLGQGSAGEVDALSEEERRIYLALMAGSGMSFLVPLSLNEAIALLGLVIAFLYGTTTVMVAFAVAACALDLSMFPRLERETQALWEMVQRGGLEA